MSAPCVRSSSTSGRSHPAPRGIARGSAILGRPQPGAEKVKIYFEGGICAQAEMRTLADRAVYACGALCVHRSRPGKWCDLRRCGAVRTLAAHIEHPSRSSPRVCSLTRAPCSRRPRYRLRAGCASLPRNSPHAPIAPPSRSCPRTNSTPSPRPSCASPPSSPTASAASPAGSTGGPAPFGSGSPAMPSVEPLARLAL